MSHHRKLKVFRIADALVVDVYRATAGFPREERYGLTSQIRRAAVSVPTNLVEGRTRTGEKEYAHFVSISLGSVLLDQWALRRSRLRHLLHVPACWRANRVCAEFALRFDRVLHRGDLHIQRRLRPSTGQFRLQRRREFRLWVRRSDIC